MSGRIDGVSALAIAKKLRAEIKEGRKHEQAVVRIGATLAGRFGIRRGKKTGHDYIPRQIHVSMKEALDLVSCPLDKEGYEKLLIARGKLPGDPSGRNRRPRS